MAEMKNQTPGDSPEERRLFWARVPEFPPDFASTSEDVKRSMTAMICIVVWAAAMGVASLYASPQITRER